jgi:hypothetical protein
MVNFACGVFHLSGEKKGSKQKEVTVRKKEERPRGRKVTGKFCS